MTMANPLLEQSLPIPFSSIKAEHVEPAVASLLEEMKERLAKLGSPDTPRTYRDILMGLDTLTEPLDNAMAVVRHLESVATTPEFRAAYNNVQEPVSAFYTSIGLDPRLWEAVKAVKETAEVRDLAGVHKRYLEKTISGFRRSGADLDEAGKRKLEELEIALTKATTKFSQNVLDATNAFELIIDNEAQLSGLPEMAREAARESARAKGKEGWRFTLQAPSYAPVLTYLDDRSIRQQMWQASSRRATEGQFNNSELIPEILRLRREKAQLLGYADFSDFVLEERMAHKGADAQQFVTELRDKTIPYFNKENESLKEIAVEHGIAEIQPWDVAHLAEKQRRKLYDFDEEELRPYFELDRVVRGMFEIFSRVLGIKVTEEENVPAWDGAVKYFRVEDAQSGKLLGGFYSDWFPRENKRGGAWMDSLLTGYPAEGRPHIGLICGNLTPPGTDRPSLLTHNEVETIFHEFGHLLHHMLSQVPVRSLSGTNVPWDFVELPSQIMENWCMEREALDLFARHYKTGEAIPDELFEKVRRARNFRAANAQMRQLGFALLDLQLHREYDPNRDGDVLAYARGILQQFTPAPLPANYGMVAAFTHLFSGPVAYGSGYYSYKWAEVLDADAFTRFQKEGIFNEQTGLAYRQNILERGDSQDPAELYRSFMGRDPDPSALLIRLGLASEAA